MKSKIILALCALSAGSVYAAPITQNGTLHLNGSIYSATCDIDINNNGGEDINVNLGRHPNSRFNSKGDEIEYNGLDGLIEVELVNCPDTGKLDVSFNGTTIAGDKTILQLDNPTSPDTAQNLGIHIYEAGKQTPLRIDDSVVFSADVTNSKTYKKDFWATYVSTQDFVDPGKANATMTFKIEYK